MHYGRLIYQSSYTVVYLVWTRCTERQEKKKQLQEAQQASEPDLDMAEMLNLTDVELF